jgi:hypothetical protein
MLIAVTRRHKEDRDEAVESAEAARVETARVPTLMPAQRTAELKAQMASTAASERGHSGGDGGGRRRGGEVRHIRLKILPRTARQRPRLGAVR